MWKYQNTDDMYIGRFNPNEKHIMHYKYLRRYVGKNGKMVYVYPKRQKSNIKIESKTAFNNGPRDNQHYTEIYNDKTRNGVSFVSGSNKKDKYVGISVGVPKDNYNYKEKSVKVGKYTLNVDNDNGTFNASLHKDHDDKKKKSTLGKSILSKLFSKK